MVTVNGFNVGVGWGIGEISFQSMGETEKDFYPNFLQPFHGNIGTRSCNVGSWEFIPVFHNPHRKDRPSHSAVPWRGALYGRVEWEGEKQVWIHIQKTSEYLEGCNPPSSLLQGMKAQSLFVVEVTNASYQPYVMLMSIFVLHGWYLP